MNHIKKFGFESVTYALEARDLLARHGISAVIVRLGRGESPKGCTFGLELANRDAAAAEALLSKAQLSHTHLN